MTGIGDVSVYYEWSLDIGLNGRYLDLDNLKYDIFSKNGIRKFLGAFHISRERRLLPSSYLSVRMYQRGSHCTDFLETRYWGLLQMYVQKLEL